MYEVKVVVRMSGTLHSLTSLSITLTQYLSGYSSISIIFSKKLFLCAKTRELYLDSLWSEYRNAISILTSYIKYYIGYKKNLTNTLRKNIFYSTIPMLIIPKISSSFIIVSNNVRFDTSRTSHTYINLHVCIYLYHVN